MKLFPRSVARMAAIQVDFQVLFREDLSILDLTTYYLHHCFPNGTHEMFEEEFFPLDITFFKALMSGVSLSYRDLDSSIQDALPGDWDVYRLEGVSRSLLRCAIAEAMHMKETHLSVILNEYITLAKFFLSQKGPAFINGILHQVIGRLRPEEVRPSTKEK